MRSACARPCRVNHQAKQNTLPSTSPWRPLSSLCARALEVLLVNGGEDLPVLHELLQGLAHLHSWRRLCVLAEHTDAHTLRPATTLPVQEVQERPPQDLALKPCLLGRGELQRTGGNRCVGRLLRRGRSGLGVRPPELQGGVRRLDEVEADLVRGLHGPETRCCKVHLGCHACVAEDVQVAAGCDVIQVGAAAVVTRLDATCPIGQGELNASGALCPSLNKAHKDQHALLRSEEAEGVAGLVRPLLYRSPNRADSHWKARVLVLGPHLLWILRGSDCRRLAEHLPTAHGLPPAQGEGMGSRLQP
mmetsp:Transcript_20091/g.55323  ORF Transcript_20091/g.55323 Transcript_20091/m.55323 type:complete len:304 (+) Transcript_20091:3-914(+)